MVQNFATKVIAYFKGYFNLAPQLLPQQQGEAAIRDGVSFRGVNIVILIFAILIASLGLNTNSTAVIIGAMLISPLMGPIIGIGLGVGVCDFHLIKTALRNLIMAAGFSVVASTCYFLISPVSEGHSELLARTSPTIYDVLIAFVGGFAGIMASSSTSSAKGNVVPGVAIATALMPPLCTAGYGLATWQLHYFFGAFYLFIINSIYIAFATFIGVKILRYKPAADIDSQRARKVRRIVYTLAILTMLPSIWLTWQMLNRSRFELAASKFVAAECEFPDTQVLSQKATWQGGNRLLTITLIGQPLPVDSLREALTKQLPAYGLQDTKIVILQGSSIIHQPATTAGMKDFYDMSQATIVSLQRQIDSLSLVLSNTKAARNLGAVVSPEVKVLFPQVSEIAVSTNIFASVENPAELDTVNVALVSFSSPMYGEQRQKFARYLEARLKLKNIEIVNTGPVK